MSIFDLFGTSAQQNAANAQIGGINAGLGAATNNINAGTSALQTNYGAALQHKGRHRSRHNPWAGLDVRPSPARPHPSLAREWRWPVDRARRAQQGRRRQRPSQLRMATST